MKVLVVNPIIYTSETADIKKVSSIKDTMIYDLCLAFKNAGHDVTLVAGAPYAPTEKETYPFEVFWAKCAFTNICKPNVLPYCPEIKKLIKQTAYDLVISSEVFSLNSFLLTRKSRGNLIIWHELAQHNRLMKQIPSKIWYGIVARLFFGHTRIVPRSEEAKAFIRRYCKNVSDTVIDHGANLTKFVPCKEKENYFVISSQLIGRKQIDKAIEKFSNFVPSHNDYQLYIFGEGEEENNLKALVKQQSLTESVIFCGKVPHAQLKEYLSKAKAMLVYTRKDNNMVSITEAIACATPVVTTDVPYNASYIRANELGIVNNCWDENDLEEICTHNGRYVENCLEYRKTISTENKVDLFIKERNKL